MQAMASNHLTSAEYFGQPFSGPLNCEPREHGVGPNRHDPPGPVLLGGSVAVRRLRSQIQRIAPHFRIALIRGEMGCGKEQIARAVHALSPAADGPFIATHAATLAESVAAGEEARPGRRSAAGSLLESASGGTLYLRGAGELTFNLQTALLEFLRECDRYRGMPPLTRPTRIGSSARRPAEIRILVGSDRDLRTLAAIGQFREDLYAQVSAVEIFAPPLRQRVEDIPLIAEWLLRRMADATGQAAKELAEETGFRLQEHLWPNNLRELERVVCQAAALADGALIEPRHLLSVVEPAYGKLARGPAVRPVRLHDVIQQHVLGVLTECGGNKLRAAEVLGISRSTLYRMLDSGPLAEKGR
jgi:DNA-binding NtrC family response regulator